MNLIPQIKKKKQLRLDRVQNLTIIHLRVVTFENKHFTLCSCLCFSTNKTQGIFQAIPPEPFQFQRQSPHSCVTSPSL